MLQKINENTYIDLSCIVFISCKYYSENDQDLFEIIFGFNTGYNIEISNLSQLDSEEMLNTVDLLISNK